MCANMNEFQTISERIFKLEQKKAKKKKEMDALEKEIKQLKSETLFTAYVNKRFDKDAFIAGKEDGEETYQKYLRNIPMEKVTVSLAKTQL